ncbi:MULTISPECIES: ligase-associated DNA damage response endonuclease PdeM [Flavobacterium]|uniref:Ligase-associated DNA damage response endonuclease PdeM n=1 Tax=Flavobacterium endoglycinae TaxID=2816357 RepID=A0ABX7QIV4_9FLAO|nr:ligase-associated DNA damage response endonuclease PdeM [Flavobacterium endoglycinae]QSW90513.1 ligase-associated DNA damage response endonuclease PdeM [Flavobacterium endoglycinae]
MNITINNQNFILHPCGAAFWEEKKILLISDLHLGKIAHFRKHGMAIPEKAVHENFNRLNAILQLFDVETIIFLGDLFHSKINNEWDFFEDWTKTVTQQLILVEGNHDIISKKYYTDLNIEIYSEITIHDFLLTHHPSTRENFFNLCGHIHPGIKLKGLGRQFLSLSCFFRKPDQMIFPAFGEFTGNFYLVPEENDKVYVLAKDEVIEIKR